MVADAHRSALERTHHPAQHELIGAGQTYLAVEDRAAMIDNVFANIASVRARSAGAT